MAVEERARQDLLDRLEQVLGTPHAQTLMSYLPPVEGPEIATSDDVATLRRDVDHRFDKIDHRFEFLDARLEAMEHRILATIRGEMAALVTTQTRVIVLGLVGALTANTGLVLAASRLG